MGRLIVGLRVHWVAHLSVAGSPEAVDLRSQAGEAQRWGTSPPAPPLAAIALRAVSVRYVRRDSGAEVTALDEVTLEIGAGKLVTLVGPSGCGKTTLLNVVAGLIPATSGDVRVTGVDHEGGRPPVGIMFQQPLLMPWRTALENVLLPVEVGGRKGPADIERAKALLESVGLRDVASAYPKELSGGMQQRVALARTLMSEPPVLLMDEPFSALDEMTREKVNLEFLRIWEKSRQTVLFVTHSVHEAVFLGDTVVVMNGRGAVEEVIDIPVPRPRGTHVLDNDVYRERLRSVRATLGLGS